MVMLVMVVPQLLAKLVHLTLSHAHIPQVPQHLPLALLDMVSTMELVLLVQPMLQDAHSQVVLLPPSLVQMDILKLTLVLLKLVVSNVVLMLPHAELLLLSILPSQHAKLHMVYKHQHLAVQVVFHAEAMPLHAQSLPTVQSQSQHAIQDMVYKHQQQVAQVVFHAEAMLPHAQSQPLVQQQSHHVFQLISLTEQHVLKTPQQIVLHMLTVPSAHLAPAHLTSQLLEHAQQEPLVTVLLTIAHNVFNATVDIISQHLQYAHHAQAIAMLAQVLQTAQHAVLDTMLLLMEHVYPTQPPQARTLKSLLQDLLSSLSSSSSSSRDEQLQY